MKIGRLDKRVSHLARGVTVDAWNHSVVSYTNRGTYWAEVQYKRGTEKQEGRQTVGVDQVHFVLRYNGSITNEDRLLYDGEYYDVHSVEVMGRNEAIRITTTKRDNAEA